MLLLIYVAYLYFQLKTHSYLFVAPEGSDEEEEGAKMNMVSAGVSLLGVTLVTSFCADWRESVLPSHLSPTTNGLLSSNWLAVTRSYGADHFSRRVNRRNGEQVQYPQGVHWSYPFASRRTFSFLPIILP